jgi:hypothetical protein
MFLNKNIKTDPSFSRSRNISSDLLNENVAKSYLWGGTTYKLLDQFLKSYQDKGELSALALTGALGTGKSAFAINLLQLLGCAGPTIQKVSLNSLKQYSKEQGGQKARFRVKNDNVFPIIIAGEKSSLCEALFYGIRKSADNLPSQHKNNKLIKEILTKKKTKNNLSPSGIVSYFVSFVKALSDLGYSGCALVIDEMGKFLEFASISSANENDTDIHVMQSIAELRLSQLDLPVFFLTILHQDIQHYAENLTAKSRTEWEKIQGRFQPLLLSPSPDENIALVLRNIKHSDSKDFQDWKRARAKFSTKGSYVPKSWNKSDYNKFLDQSAPFCAISLFALTELSKSLGQNNRSTFTFLSSFQENSLNDFIDRTDFEAQHALSLDTLYDYFTYNLIRTSGVISKVIAEIESALEQIEGDSLFQSEQVNYRKIIKVIGVLTLLNSPFRFSKSIGNILEGMGDFRLNKNDCLMLLNHLVKNKILIYREIKKEYMLWQGSDFDLEGNVKEYIQNDYNAENSLKYISTHLTFLPIVANKHYEITGTLRFFDLKIIGINELNYIKNGLNEYDVSKNQNDGFIILCFSTNESERKEFIDFAKNDNDKLKIWIIPQSHPEISNNIGIYSALTSILQNEVSIKGDRVVIREIKDRIKHIDQLLQEQLDELFWSFNQTSRIINATSNDSNNIKCHKSFNMYISDVVNEVFYKSPYLSNEMINRKVISSTIKSSIFKLAEATMANEKMMDLAMEGFPPHKTIYRSLLLRNGFHRLQDNGSWAFSTPTDEKWKELWKELENIFQNNINKELKITKLISKFEAEPYGMREPVILFMLFHFYWTHKEQIALYYENSYTPNAEPKEIQLLLKRPEYFSFRAISGSKDGSAYLEGVWKGLSPKSDVPDNLAFNIGKIIYREIRELTEYSLQTKNLPSHIIELREFVRKSQKIDELIFKDIPRIHNIKILEDYGTGEKVGKCLLDSFIELKNSFETLKTKTLEIFSEEFEFSGKLKLLRSDVKKKTQNMRLDDILNLKLKSLVSKMQDMKTTDWVWFQNIANAIILKPMNRWGDVNLLTFRENTRELHRAFQGVWSIHLEDWLDEKTNCLYVSITDKHGESKGEVITLPDSNEDIQKKVKEILDLFKGKSSTSLKKSVLLKVLTESMKN